jgi:hypothetical protein
MNPNIIFYPVFAMFLLTAAVLLRLASLRLMAVRKGQVRLSWYRFYRGESGESDRMIFTSRNYINLFEMPVLFYTGVILVYVTDMVDMTFVILAWLYVLARCVHSAIHVTSNRVPWRFNAFLISNLFLLALWGRLAFQLITEG